MVLETKQEQLEQLQRIHRGTKELLLQILSLTENFEKISSNMSTVNESIESWSRAQEATKLMSEGKPVLEMGPDSN